MPTTPQPEPSDRSTPEPATPAATAAETRRWRTAGFVLLLGEAAAPLAGAVWALVLIVSGKAVVVRNDLMVGVLLLITGLGLVLVALRVREGRPGIKVASLLWQVLLVLAVAGPAWQAGRPALAALIVVWAVATGVATIKATREVPPAG